jgi:hypothetical protein
VSDPLIAIRPETADDAANVGKLLVNAVAGPAAAAFGDLG